MSIQIRFVSYQYKRWMRAVDRLKATALSEKDNLPRKMSIDYIDEIRRNVYVGKFNYTYPKLNTRYAAWKLKYFNTMGGFWLLRGELVQSLRSQRAKGGWFGGVPAGVYDSGNVSWLGKGDRGRKLPIALYATWAEYGRKGQPPRPLFRPTLIDYSETGALKRLNESRIKIIGGWR